MGRPCTRSRPEERDFIQSHRVTPHQPMSSILTMVLPFHIPMVPMVGISHPYAHLYPHRLPWLLDPRGIQTGMGYKDLAWKPCLTDPSPSCRLNGMVPKSTNKH